MRFEKQGGRSAPGLFCYVKKRLDEVQRVVGAVLAPGLGPLRRYGLIRGAHLGDELRRRAPREDERELYPVTGMPFPLPHLTGRWITFGSVIWQRRWISQVRGIAGT